ncbi:MAG TPA: hypothetical protein VF432_26995 [Thermoanaerobaculia bacterium]
MSRTVWVDQRDNPVRPDGSLDRPYQTIQTAIDAAAAKTPAPSAANPVTIAILQGVYAENVVVRTDGLCLRGFGGVATIKPAQGPALVVSNASATAVQQYISSGDPQALQGSSVKGKSPRSLQLFDVNLETKDAGPAAVYIAGDPKGEPVGDGEIVFNRCRIVPASGKALNAYFTHYIHFRDSSEVYGATDILNCVAVWVDDTMMVDFTLTWNSKHALSVPKAPGTGTAAQFGLVGYHAFFVGGTVTLQNDVAEKVWQPTVDSTFFQLDIRGNNRFEMVGGTVTTLNVDATANWKGTNVCVQQSGTYIPPAP